MPSASDWPTSSRGGCSTKIDCDSTYANVITSSFLERGKIPIVADTDREAFDMALRSCGYVEAGRERIVRILDTLHLEEVYVSPADCRRAIGIGTGSNCWGHGPELFDQTGRLTDF